MASSAPWLRWTQTDLGTGCEELKRWEEEEEEEEEDFERHMDENGVIGLEEDGLVAVSSRPGSSRFGEAPAGSMDLSDLQDSGSEEWGREDAGSPPSGDGEDLDEGSPVEPARWHPRQDLTEEEEEEGEEEEEERGSSMEDERLEGPWGAESDGELHPKAGPLQKAPCVTMDGGDTSGASDTSPGPATPPRRRRGWGRAGDTHGSRGQGWGPSQSRSAPQNTAGSRAEPSPKPGPLGSPQTPRQHQRPRVPEPGRLSRSLSPRRHAGAKKPKEATEGCRYGRGQLNHPLPDLSKVEARVKFDQSYRPPPSRALPARARTPGGPLIPKSPAEIVREVLLSSGEGAPPQPPVPPGVPQELRSPRQATALVQQLQDDYHKLLTKYAEAENTIDQLRLGAKVSLYADPPRASRSAHAGTLGSGCRVMAFSIPRASTATVSTAPNPNPAPNPKPAPTPPLSVDGDLGPAEWGASQRPRSPLSSSGGCPTCAGQCRCPGPQLTRTLAGQTRKLQAQVESFEGWVRAGSAAPQEQLQRFRRLKETQDALERAYLRAREEHGRQRQRPAASGDFDPERAVEGEIFCLGMRLEELKERLEWAARPPGSPCPQLSPAVTEAPPGTQGTSGDGEVVAGGLSRPLWHKQLRAEDDFGDLLEHYQHFKSLPASLSLEHLSLAGSGSLEEADGPVAGDVGPRQVPCRARSLEEGTDLETSPSRPPQRRAAPLPHGDPLRPEGTRGHHQEPPAAPRPPPPVLPEPLPPRAPLSRHSSGAGTAATQRRPLKPCRQEQRMVSPETDSGFVGSEASRVSPLVRTPEHRPLGTGTPGSLGPPAPIPAPLRPPQKKDAQPLPREKAPMGTYPSPRHLSPRGGVGGPSLPPSTASHSSSPPRWAESLGSELGPDGDGGEQPAPGAAPRPPPPPSPPPACSPARSDSEGGGRSCASACGPLLGGGTASPSPAPAPCDLLGSRVERDRAIRALRDEVWRLRRRLEESLRRSRSYPEGKAAPRSAQARRQPAASGPSSPRDAAPTGELSPPARGRVAPAAVTRGRSASLPRDGTELDLSSESGRSLAGHGDGRHRGTPATQKRSRSPPGMGTVRGQYTGTRYQVPPPATPAPRGEPSTPGCPQCCGSRTASAGSPAGDAVRQPRQSTPRTRRCPTCRAPRAVPTPGSRDGAAHAELGTDAASSPGSRPHPRAEPPEQPGLWYLAGGPPVGYLAPVPLVPYAPPLLYCSPAVPTSAPAPPQRPPLGLPLADLEELQRSLGRAVEAAQRARLTTKRMGRSLASELSRARGLRGSCLF